jgi:hypothetical protein
MHAARAVAAATGAALLVLGVVGLVATHGLPFADPVGVRLWHVGTNPLLAVVHLAAGAALATGAMGSDDAARRIAASVGTLALLLGLGGLFLVGQPHNVLAVTSWSNLTHLAVSCALLAASAVRLPAATEHTV